jgi:putative flippase GtrA
MTEFLKKYKSIILYIIFGGMTTVVDWSVSFLLYYLWGDAIEATPLLLHGADVIAWVAAVAFAYVTNRIWVFESKRRGFLPILGEIAAFAGGRVVTLLLQEAIMAVFCTWLGLNMYLFKIVAAVLVVILNYFISKLLVFRKSKRETGGSTES